MGLIAIAANPASGRDIRRLVSHASVYSNREKANTVERIILAAAQLGSHRFAIMPDSYGFGHHVTCHLVEELKLVAPGMITVPQLDVSENAGDTAAFAQWAERQGASVLIVLGGDGTSRAAAKGAVDIPMISLSTGTNNVFPEMVEGTVVGMAAAALADGIVPGDACCARCKRIEIDRNGVFTDIALIDAVFSGYAYTGAKAIWEREDINRVVVSQCHPASIGFSALLGSSLTVLPEEDCGAMADCADGSPNVRTSLAAGVITPFRLENLQTVPLGKPLDWTMERVGTLALDGEREVRWAQGETITLRVTRKGPLRVDLRKTLTAAQAMGYFKFTP